MECVFRFVFKSNQIYSPGYKEWKVECRDRKLTFYNKPKMNKNNENKKKSTCQRFRFSIPLLFCFRQHESKPYFLHNAYYTRLPFQPSRMLPIYLSPVSISFFCIWNSITFVLQSINIPNLMMFKHNNYNELNLIIINIAK